LLGKKRYTSPLRWIFCLSSIAIFNNAMYLERASRGIGNSRRRRLSSDGRVLMGEQRWAGIGERAAAATASVGGGQAGAAGVDSISGHRRVAAGEQ
jgi:hypothetical protein